MGFAVLGEGGHAATRAAFWIDDRTSTESAAEALADLGAVGKVRQPNRRLRRDGARRPPGRHRPH